MLDEDMRVDSRVDSLSRGADPAGEADDADDLFGPLQGGERVLWRGHAGVAEYAFDQARSMPRWTLPEATQVLVTDRRVLYSYAASATEIVAGEIRWLWPQHLRVQPGRRIPGRSTGEVAQIQLVCGSADGGFPTLVFAGGTLRRLVEADRLANLLRRAIAQFRLDNADKLPLTTPQGRMLSRLLIGPEFSNQPGGDGQHVPLPGALPVSRPAELEPSEYVDALPNAPISAAPLPALEAAPVSTPGRPLAAIEDDSPEPPLGGDTRLLSYRPGLAADAERARIAAQHEEAVHQTPHIASRAASLASRIAALVGRPHKPSTELVRAEPPADATRRIVPPTAAPLDTEDATRRIVPPTAPLEAVPLQAGPLQAGPLQAGPLQAGPLRPEAPQAGPRVAAPRAAEDATRRIQPPLRPAFDRPVGPAISSTRLQRTEDDARGEPRQRPPAHVSFVDRRDDEPGDRRPIASDLAALLRGGDGPGTDFPAGTPRRMPAQAPAREAGLAALAAEAGLAAPEDLTISRTDLPVIDLSARLAASKRLAARFANNSGRGRGGVRRAADREIGAITRGTHRH